MSRLYIPAPVINPNRMKIFVLSAIVLLCLSALPVWAQMYGSMYNPIDAGDFSSSGTRDFWDNENNNNNGFGNNIGQYSDDIWYRFTISSTTQINISLCGSDFDTFLHLLDENGNELVSNDDNGPLCTGIQSSIQTTLSPGVYYAVAEGSGYNSGNIVIEISNTVGNTFPIADALATAIDAGYFGSCGSRAFMDYKNNSPGNGFGDKFGQPSDDIFYRFTVCATAQINISLCGSNFDTYLHLLDQYGNEMESNDDSGPLCSGAQSSLQTTLSPGTYYVVAEGWSSNSGDIALEISYTGSGSLPPGASLATAIDAGTLSTTFTDTRNNSPENCYQNLIGYPSNEIYYKFTLSTNAEVSISHCGSAIDTYMHLLDNNGTEIASNDDNGPLCTGYQASIKMTLGAGIYYVASEGYNVYSGNITTTISKSISVNYPPPTANFSQNKNYIVTYTPLVSGMMDADSVRGKDIPALIQQVQYFNDLGKPEQTVTFKGSPELNDIVQPIIYDRYGREARKYLPYISTVNNGSYKDNSLTEQYSFYTSSNSVNAKCIIDSRPFSETIFDDSPLNRPIKQFGTGQEWYAGYPVTAGHPVAIDYQSNVAGEVRLWTISNSSINGSVYYNPGTLHKTQTTDENGNNNWEFKDMQDRVVLKQVEDNNGALLKTYYVYNDFGYLAYVIPPKATLDTYTEGDPGFNELLYAYHYDPLGRMTEKHIPGAGWTYMVYNNIDQLILTQDENQRAATPNKKWLFTKYDALGRVVMTGTFENDNSRDNIQDIVKNETVLWEARDGSTYNYSNYAYPSTDYSNLLTLNYYDDYGFDREGKTFQTALGYTAESSMTKGLLTGSKVKVLDGSNTWLTSVTYYDDKGHPIQVTSKNILGTWEKVTTQYDFVGKALQSERTHNNSALTLTNRYEYDHAGRKKGVYQQTGSGAEVELADYNYNELGQLVKKYLHGNSSSHVQGINYRYNIRGWLTSINNASLENDGLLNDEDNSAFGEELTYNNSFPAGNTSTGTDQWNGNISGVQWKSKGPDVVPSTLPVNAYAFQYDKLNRMTLADYGSGYGSSFGDQSGYFNEQLTYDVMGNILTLNRNSSGNPMDNLSYAYAANSNKLLSVTDYSGNTAGFNDRNNSGDDYAYDAGGNLTTDLNKGLTIDYNFLNLPKSVYSSLESKTMGYTYDATGRKLKKTFDGNTHYYIDGIEYENTGFLFAMTEEGRVRQGSGGYTYDYFLKDHLGNVRVVLSTDGTQRNSVYPAATMETMTAASESTYYSNLDKVRSFTPVGFKSIKKNEKVAHLKGTDPNKQIGPSITVKVNSGDTISLTAQSFYPDNTGTQRTGLAETALSQLVNAIINPAGLSNKGKAFATDNLKTQGFDKSAGYQNMMNKLPNSDYNNENNRPKAYMVWMLFDNEMKLVKTGKSSGARQIPEGAGQVKQMTESGIVMDQGGFLTAYTVNESPASVYIDNFQLSVASGGLLEENHYYPFGMLIDGLSKPGNTDPINNYKYNGKELQNELSLQWLDYGARFYDPVIGRWHSVDPLAEKYRKWSPYNYAVDNSVRFIDPDGMGPGGPPYISTFSPEQNVASGKVIRDIYNNKITQDVVGVVGGVLSIAYGGPIGIALGISSTGLSSAKLIGHLMPSKFDQGKVDKTPTTVSGAIAGASFEMLGGKFEKGAAIGDVVQSTSELNVKLPNMSSGQLTSLVFSGVNTSMAVSQAHDLYSSPSDSKIQNNSNINTSSQANSNSNVNSANPWQQTLPKSIVLQNTPMISQRINFSWLTQ